MKNEEILKWVEPKIQLDEMNAINFKNIGDNEQTIDNLGNKPWITIRSYSLDYNKIISLIIDSSDFYPVIYLHFYDKDNSFKSFDFPIDQDIISIYLKPKADNIHKSIRCDFYITEISGTDIIHIKGILKIPNSFDSKTFAINSSSIEAAFKSSRELNLGFASNYENSNDIQNWISFNQTFYDFIKNNVEKYAFINRESWIISFIDLFYNFNWLNGESIYSVDSNLDKGIITMFNNILNQNILDDKTKQKNSKIDTFFLTNHPNFQSTDYGITIEPDFRTYNKYEFGHINNSYFIDMSNKTVKTENLFINEQNHESWKVINGRDEKDILVEKISWNGLQSSNVHENFITAKSQYEINNKNMLCIKIVSEGITTEIMRGRRLPIFVINLNSSEMALTEENFNMNETPRLSEFWSGFYVVDSVRFEWNSNGWKTYSTLKRKQWDISKRKNHFGSIT